MIRPVVLHGDPILHTATMAVVAYDAELATLVRDMFETMYNEGGIGLSANQVGVPRRVFVYNVGRDMGVFVNPVLERSGTFATDYEGCLSVPGALVKVQRYTKVTMSGWDEHGQEQQIVARGLLARCFQHELDHLHGKTMLDRCGVVERRRGLTEFNHWARRSA